MPNDKMILEKNDHGDDVFTPYGEFLSYFFAHQQLFTSIIKSKEADAAKANHKISQIKSFMKANIKNTDQFFENMKSFSEMLGYSEQALNTYLQKNFATALNKVQEELIKQEKTKPVTKAVVKYELLSEEIVKELDFSMQDLRFITQDNQIVIENMKDGSIQQPSTTMVSDAPAKTEEKKKEVAPVVQQKEKLILDEIIQGFGDKLTGKKIEMIEAASSSELVETEIQNSASEFEIDDIEFDGPTTTEEETEEEPPEETSDISDILGLVDDAPAAVQPPDEIDKYTYIEYSRILNSVQGFMQKKDTAGYNQWLATQDHTNKSVISLKNFIAKQAKGEAVDWNQLLSSIASKTGLSLDQLQRLKEKITDFGKFKTGLETTVRTLGKNPELASLVKMAWPHISKASMDFPDKDSIQYNLEQLFKKIPNAEQRQQIASAFTRLLDSL